MLIRLVPTCAFSVVDPMTGILVPFAAKSGCEFSLMSLTSTNFAGISVTSQPVSNRQR